MDLYEWPSGDSDVEEEEIDAIVERGVDRAARNIWTDDFYRLDIGSALITVCVHNILICAKIKYKMPTHIKRI